VSLWVISTLNADALAELREWVDDRVAQALAEREQRDRLARGQLMGHREGRRVYLRRSEIDRDLGGST
jgi:hypothetical protein